MMPGVSTAQVRFGGAEAVVVPWDNGGESPEAAAA